MFSKTKKQLARHEIAALTARAFGSAAAVQDVKELTDGWYNSAYDITLADGTSAVLKISPPASVKTMRYEQNMMSAELETLKLLAGLGTVPVPKLYYEDRSRELLDSDYFFQEKLKGLPFNRLKDTMTPGEIAAVESELAMYSLRMNAVSHERFGCVAIADSQRATWKEAFLVLADWLLQDGKEASVELPGISYEEAERLIRDHADSLDAVRTPRLVYWDLWEGNFFVNEGAITGFIDSERALWADPLMEHYFSHFVHSEAFWSSYGMDPRSPELARRRKLYDLYLVLVLVIECGYRGYNEDHVNWTRQNLAERVAALRGLG